jgi:hypothetical protein
MLLVAHLVSICVWLSKLLYDRIQKIAAGTDQAEGKQNDVLFMNDIPL